MTRSREAGPDFVQQRMAMPHPPSMSSATDEPMRLLRSSGDCNRARYGSICSMIE
jgi:hypothetical protein